MEQSGSVDTPPPPLTLSRLTSGAEYADERWDILRYHVSFSSPALVSLELNFVLVLHHANIHPHLVTDQLLLPFPRER